MKRRYNYLIGEEVKIINSGFLSSPELNTIEIDKNYPDLIGTVYDIDLQHVWLACRCKDGCAVGFKFYQDHIKPYVEPNILDEELFEI
jgi:hypothetical protein